MATRKRGSTKTRFAIFLGSVEAFSGLCIFLARKMELLLPDRHYGNACFTIHTVLLWMGIAGCTIDISGSMMAIWLEGGYGTSARELRAMTNRVSIRPRRRQRFGEVPLMGRIRFQ